MRLLHTSDWHLGQTLHDHDRSHEHQCFLDWLVEALARERIDVLLVAGDVFDTANPSAAAQRQFYAFLHAARARCPALQMVITAGNHDSAARLEAPRPLLQPHGVHLVGLVPRGPDGAIDAAQLVLPLHGADGAIQAWCLAVPFLRPADLPRVEPAEGEANEYADAYQLGIAALYRAALEHALHLRQPGQTIVAMGHCHMVQGQVSQDSERRLVIGGTEATPVTVFGAEIAYAALGHLHLAQRVGGLEHVRYCGSPLPLSFSEIGYTHQVLVIELDGGTPASVRSLPVPRSVELLRVPARHAPLADTLAALEALDPPDLPEHARPLLEVRVRLDGPEPGLRARVEAALAGKPVRLARIDPQRADSTLEAEQIALSADQLATLQPADLFQRLYTLRYGDAAPPDQLAAFRELLAETGTEAQP
jgi:exonuclease SbcD